MRRRRASRDNFLDADWCHFRGVVGLMVSLSHFVPKRSRVLACDFRVGDIPIPSVTRAALSLLRIRVQLRRIKYLRIFDWSTSILKASSIRPPHYMGEKLTARSRLHRLFDAIGVHQNAPLLEKEPTYQTCMWLGCNAQFHVSTRICSNGHQN